MASFWIWTAALVLYALFLAWYVNWRGRLSAAEIEAFMTGIVARNREANDRNDPAVIRRFLEADDGREFFMLNLVRISPDDVLDPRTGERRPARRVMEGYTRMFLPALLARAGHPAMVARKVGGYVDAWGVDPGPDWTLVGYMRYRSRRDLAALVNDPRFSGAHDFKFAAMPQTFSFPTQPSMLTLVSPRIWVGLLVALVAAFAQIGVLLTR